MAPVERELKLRLPDARAWEAVMQRLGDPVAALNQENVYLDAPDGRVAASRCMLRLRCEGEERSRWLTFKRGVRAEGGYFQAVEVESRVTGEQWARLGRGEDGEDLWDLPPLQAFQEAFGRAPLQARGRVVNLRMRFPLPEGEEVLELDMTRFPGGREDYEIEVETRDPGRVRAWLEDLARELGIALEEQTRTKYERFLEALGSGC